MIRKEIKNNWPFYLCLSLVMMAFVILFLFFAPDPQAKQLMIIVLAIIYILWGMAYQAKTKHLTWSIFLEYFFVAILVALLLWSLTLW